MTDGLIEEVEEEEGEKQQPGKNEEREGERREERGERREERR